MKIDIVIPWVDGEDPVLQSKRKQAQNRLSGNENITGEPELNGEYRYRDSGLLKYVFRSIDKFAPWVNRVFFVTDNQRPDWLNVENPRLTLVNHDDYIPKQWLPTFSSNPILLNLHRIEGLSNNFILFNDDMLINKPVAPSDFFASETAVKDMAIYSVIPADDDFSHLILNDTIAINKYFGKLDLFKKAPFKVANLRYGKALIRSLLTLPWHSIAGFYNPHMPQPYLKQTFEKVWQLEAEVLKNTSSHQFRDPADLTDWVFRYWQIQNNEFEPQSINFGKYYEQIEHEAIKQDIADSKHALLYINDTPSSQGEEQVSTEIIDMLKQKFSEKSSFEL